MDEQKNVLKSFFCFWFVLAFRQAKWFEGRQPRFVSEDFELDGQGRKTGHGKSRPTHAR